MLSWLVRRVFPPCPHRTRYSGSKQSQCRPRLEALEGRLTPSLTGTQFDIYRPSDGFNVFPDLPSAPASASSRNGVSAVAYTNFSPDGGNWGTINLQLFNADGSKHGNPIFVAGASEFGFGVPSVAMDNAGNSVVVWTDRNNNVFAARYNANGARLGAVLTVAATAMKEYDASVAVSGSGEFVITYTREATSINGDVIARRFTAAGAPISSFFVANSSANEFYSRVARSTGTDARFSIAYNVGGDVYLKRYSATGTLLGTNVVGYGPNYQAVPRLDMDDAGNTVVVWQELVGSDWNIYARRVTAAGVNGSTLSIAKTTRRETLAGVAVDRSDGDFVLTYQSQTSASSPSTVYVTEFTSAGIRKGTYSLGTQHSFAGASISISAADRYFVAYVGDVTVHKDPSNSNSEQVNTTAIFGRFGQLV